MIISLCLCAARIITVVIVMCGVVGVGGVWGIVCVWDVFLSVAVLVARPFVHKIEICC